MTATIFKNDNFETVGFKVSHANETLFKWGVQCEELYYSKVINADKYTKEILDLIRLERMRNYYGWDFVKEVFEVTTDPRNLAKRKDPKDNSLFISEHVNEQSAEIEKAIKNLIERIK